ncbi:DUF1501 domain-containing protein [Acanthopleuribacter pedis]|uniref:DUF1501 domain-containing protein n=1 Tax=Acanthopleuribacter pedis TaxID=442870 RepID=A0A8J7QI66_9BACT|nr:DUF1501 domain-containing protein [Acanthopleuribacter pedis]MBO1320765.1 DUF1501 domain-containing protein [Acanthopleuribacter pedis]
MKRRSFLRHTAGALAGSITLPSLLGATPSRNQAAKAPSKNSAKKLLLIFQRGGNDALNTLVPVGDAAEYAAYRAARPNLGLAKSDLLSLQASDFFGFHPSLAPMADLINGGRVSFVSGVGYPDMNTSHFVSQAVWETGEPGNRHGSGWLNRYLQASSRDAVPRALMIDSNQSQTMSGAYTVPVSENFGALDLPLPADAGPDAGRLQALMRNLNRLDAEAAQAGWTDSTDRLFSMFDRFRNRDLSQYQPANGAKYPNSRFGRNLQHAVQLLKDQPTPLNLNSVMVNHVGYDHHRDQIGADVLSGSHAHLLGELALGIQAASADLGSELDDVLILVVSEFSRTVRENGSRGTDHGGGAVAMLVGGSATGRLVNSGAHWPGLTDHKLPWVTDFRDLYAEVLERHLGASQSEIGAALPNYTANRLGILG